MSKVNLITQAAYAKLRGVSEAAVSQAIKAGRISLIEGKIDPDVANLQWARNSRVRVGAGKAPPAAPGDAALPGPLVGDGDDPEPKPGGDDYWNSRSRREAAEAELAEIELAERNGQVIQVKAVEAVWAQALGATREHLMQVRARLTPLLAAESDPFKVDQLLDVELSEALQKMACAQLKAAGPSA